MTINWTALRSWNGLQQNAFEELCCQLARAESYPNGSKFVRKGTPDAGVECYWTTPAGDDHAWQAKFHLARPGKTQWGEIDKSVTTALDKHPRLTRYIICLPIDRADPRIVDHTGRQQKWFMDSWDAHVAKWTTWASDRHMTVLFDYWGDSEIFHRLALEEHAGRHYFWFNEKLFSDKWFRDRYEEARISAGERYTPELNVDLPIARVFDGLGRAEAFFVRFQTLRGVVRKEARSVAPDVQATLQDLLGGVIELMSVFDWRDPVVAIPLAEIRQRCLGTSVAVRAVAEQLDAREEEETTRERESRLYTRNRLDRIARGMRDIADATHSPEALVANINALLIRGEAGTGKTHLLCDVAERRINDRLPTLLLLGEQFSLGHPWPQVMSMLHLSCTAEVFLGALDVAAEARNARALILVDALNESDDRSIWHKHLAAMLTMCRRYSHIAVGLSVRTSYENDVVPDNLVPDKLLVETHEGFSGHEYRATRTFFSAFGIMRPAVPLLNPEFDNPLFLKLFCKGIQSAGLTKVPPGLRGITLIFAFLIDRTNEKLARSDQLDYDEKDHLVRRALDELAAAMAQQGRRFLARADAKDIVNEHLPNRAYGKSLFRRLLDEGLLTQDKVWRNGSSVDGVRFGYERLADHLIAAQLLVSHVDIDAPAAAFTATAPLGALLRSRDSGWTRGLLDALAVQVPEQFGVELSDLLPEHRLMPAIRHAMIQSLLWRKPDTVNRRTARYLREVWRNHREDSDDLIDALLTVAGDQDHPLNAHFLHRYLYHFDMPVRDRWWSTIVAHEWGRHRSVDRLVDWAWSDSDDKAHLSDDSIELVATALAWFLSTPNRPLRDRATKALVALLEPRPAVLRALLKAFAFVNDPYVVERIYCVAYGCAMKTHDLTALAELASQIYVSVFADGRPFPHVLTRDYARGVIEFALHRGLAIGIDAEKIRPPYASDPPRGFLSKEEFERAGEWSETTTREEWSLHAIHSSVGEGGDFGRYVIGSNNHTFPFDSELLDAPDLRREVQLFIKALSPEENELRDEYRKAEAIGEIIRNRNVRLAGVDAESPAELDAEIAEIKAGFFAALGEQRAAYYEAVVRPHLDDPRARTPTFDLAAAQRWVFQRVLDLGWTVERFGWFDQSIGRGLDRLEGDRPERMGKKYQWLAWNEFVARVADNYRFYDQHEKDRRSYDGPWQLRLRDIDPSLLLSRTGTQRLTNHQMQWWSPTPFGQWQSPSDEVLWVSSTADIPDPRRLIDVSSPDGARWLNLQMHVRWEEPGRPGEDKWDDAHRVMWYDIRSYVVRREHASAVWAWAEAQNHSVTRISDMAVNHKTYLGEYYWAPAYHYFQNPYYGNDGWVCERYMPHPLLRSTEGYKWEGSGLDASIDEAVEIILPARLLADGMSLRHGALPGTLVDNNGNVVFQNPSVTESGSGALTAARQPLLQFLEREGYELLWTVTGERQAFPGRMQPFNVTPLYLSGAFCLIDGKVHGSFGPRGN
jgi:hypothetical protein